jgi:hypothetical protein
MNFESAKPDGGEKRVGASGRPKQLRTTMQFDGRGEEQVSYFSGAKVAATKKQGIGGSRGSIQERFLTSFGMTVFANDRFFVLGNGWISG